MLVAAQRPEHPAGREGKEMQDRAPVRPVRSCARVRSERAAAGARSVGLSFCPQRGLVFAWPQRLCNVGGAFGRLTPFRPSLPTYQERCPPFLPNLQVNTSQTWLSMWRSAQLPARWTAPSVSIVPTSFLVCTTATVVRRSPLSWMTRRHRPASQQGCARCVWTWMTGARGGESGARPQHRAM